MFRKLKSSKPQHAEIEASPSEFLVAGLVEAQHKPTIISEGCRIEGTLASVGAIHIEGEVQGNVEAENLTIGEKGLVHGEIKCRSASIMGRFDGHAECDELSLGRQAVVQGRIHYKRLKAALGAIIQGELLVR